MTGKLVNWKPLAVLTILFMTGCAVPSEPRVVLQLAGYGIIESTRVTMRADETSSVGAKRADAQSMHISVTADRVPLRPGLSYGVAFRVTRAASPTVRIRAVLRTSSACVLKTSGEVVYHNDTVLTVAVGELRHLGARIPASQSENHCVGDPQPGTDTFELYFEDKKLAEKTIEVYRE